MSQEATEPIIVTTVGTDTGYWLVVNGRIICHQVEDEQGNTLEALWVVKEALEAACLSWQRRDAPDLWAALKKIADETGIIAADTLEFIAQKNGFK